MVSQNLRLRKAMAGEMVEFPGGVMGMVLNLESESVGVAILGDYTQIKEGSTVSALAESCKCQL